MLEPLRPHVVRTGPIREWAGRGRDQGFLCPHGSLTRGPVAIDRGSHGRETRPRPSATNDRSWRSICGAADALRPRMDQTQGWPGMRMQRALTKCLVTRQSESAPFRPCLSTCSGTIRTTLCRAWPNSTKPESSAQGRLLTRATRRSSPPPCVRRSFQRTRPLGPIRRSDVRRRRRLRMHSRS
jgi:hypothetical protein